MGQFRVLYLGETLLACYVETLQQFRQTPAELTRLRSMLDDISNVAESQQSQPIHSPADSLEYPTNELPQGWLDSRCRGLLQIAMDLPMLDLCSHDTREKLKREIAGFLSSEGYDDFDLSVVLKNGKRGRRVTQYIARWVYDRGRTLIKYPSRFGSEYICYALMEPPPNWRGTLFTTVQCDRVERSDPELVRAATLHHLVIPGVHA